MFYGSRFHINNRCFSNMFYTLALIDIIVLRYATSRSSNEQIELSSSNSQPSLAHFTKAGLDSFTPVIPLLWRYLSAQFYCDCKGLWKFPRIIIISNPKQTLIAYVFLEDSNLKLLIKLLFQKIQVHHSGVFILLMVVQKSGQKNHRLDV